MTELKYLRDLWNDADTLGMDEVELLRYRSNLLGSDLRLTNFGGGNTSAKVSAIDPITGESVEVMWVKGSGGDLGTIKRDGFASLYMNRLVALKRQYKGVEFEDEMPGLFPLCTFNNNPRAASIDTPLHGFLPFPHVDHLHPDWAIALAACANGPAQLERLRAETGVHLVWVPWKRPGFELGLWLEQTVVENPNCDGIILGSHGLFTWGNSGRESYLKTLQVIDAIGQYVIPRVEMRGEALFGGTLYRVRPDAEQIALELLPVLRGLLGHGLGHYESGPDAQQFINSHRAEALAYMGTSCPDHFVRTKVRPLYVKWDPTTGDLESLQPAIKHGLHQYGLDYQAYYDRCKRPNSPAMRSPNPTVVLVPGVGLFSFGKNKVEARITGEFYVNAIHVMEGATALDDFPAQPSVPTDQVVDNYVALAPQEAFDIEYWLLEEAKLQRMPAEKELSRKVALLVGASPGIGKEIADRVLREGGHLVIADLNADLAASLAESLQIKYGKETVTSVSVDCTDRESCRKALALVTQTYGGIDILISIAAVFIAPDANGQISDALWKKTYEINVLGSFVIAQEAAAVMKKQGTRSSIVLVSSANAVVAKRGSVAYDTSKAAVNHLVRELAIEFAPYVRVNAVAPATVVEGSQMFPRDRTIASLSKYEIPFSEEETTEELRSKLALFYAKRTLLHAVVTPAKVAEGAFLLASDRTSLMTGQVLPVDGGLIEAFLR